MGAFWYSFGIIFVAELGDKSQLMALTFATRFKPLPVLAGITIATAVVHAFSVGLGAAIGTALDPRLIAFVGAIAFFGFGLWTLRGDKLTDEERERANATTRNAFLAVAVTFFLAELGDKTMLATVTVATTHSAWGTWAGSTVGMVAADALAIVVGRQLGNRLSDRTIRIGAAIAFFAFAAYMLYDALSM
jgi:putative Ca2+/H+ antiporter (TMEM165/GDT1 family)